VKEDGAPEAPSSIPEEDLRIALELYRQIRGLIDLTCGCEVAPATRHPNGSWVAGWASTSYTVCDAHRWLCPAAHVWRNKNGDVVSKADWDANWDDTKPYLIGSNLQKIYKDGGCSPFSHTSSTTKVEFAETVERYKSLGKDTP
jgi:hypothetical protein